MRPVPVGTDPTLAAFLAELRSAVSQLQVPNGYGPAFLTASTDLSAVTAARYPARWGIATDLKTVVWSDGAHWYRTDTGAQIV